VDEGAVDEATAVSDRGWWTAAVAAAVGVGVLLATTVADQSRNYAAIGLAVIVVLFLTTCFGAWLPLAARVVGVGLAVFTAFVSLAGLAYLVPIPGVIGLAIAWLSAVPTEGPPMRSLLLAAGAGVVGIGIVAVTPPDHDGLVFEGVSRHGNLNALALIELPGVTSFRVLGVDGVCIGVEARVTNEEIDAIVAAVNEVGGELLDDESC
jgi:hypothetical protein